MFALKKRSSSLIFFPSIRSLSCFIPSHRQLPVPNPLDRYWPAAHSLQFPFRDFPYICIAHLSLLDGEIGPIEQTPSSLSVYWNGFRMLTSWICYQHIQSSQVEPPLPPRFSSVIVIYYSIWSSLAVSSHCSDSIACFSHYYILTHMTKQNKWNIPGNGRAG